MTANSFFTVLLFVVIVFHICMYPHKFGWSRALLTLLLFPLVIIDALREKKLWLYAEAAMLLVIFSYISILMFDIGNKESKYEYKYAEVFVNDILYDANGDSNETYVFLFTSSINSVVKKHSLHDRWNMTSPIQATHAIRKDLTVDKTHEVGIFKLGLPADFPDKNAIFQWLILESSGVSTINNKVMEIRIADKAEGVRVPALVNPDS